MIKIVFSGWSVGMRRLAFSIYLHEKTNLSLSESRDIGFRITDNEVVEIYIDNIELANEIVQKVTELGVKAYIEI